MQNQANRRNQVRIISGSLRRRKITFPDSEGLRPTADRIRETLFNWLEEQVAGARCLDLFAGSGALSLEALSRGAASADLVESSAQVCRALRDNLSLLGLHNARVHQAEARQWLTRQTGHSPGYHLVFVDPPYSSRCLISVCQRLQQSQLLAPDARVYLEDSRAIVEKDLPDSWTKLKYKKAGQVYFYLFACGETRRQRESRTEVGE